MVTYQPKCSPFRTRANIRQFLKDAENANNFLHNPDQISSSTDLTNPKLQGKTLLDMSDQELKQYFMS